MSDKHSSPHTDFADGGDLAGHGKIVQLVKAEGSSTIQNVVQQVFIGDYERLRDAYIPPWSVFERVRLDHFVGREWLLAEVDTFLHNHDRGYFIVEAEAGLGKTTFLAWLVRERGYIHHFTELAPGPDGVGRGLKNLAAQLVLAYQLSAYEAEGVLPGAATRPDYLYNLLKQVATRREDGEKIVLVVDALDEAGTPYSQNVLGLPQVLPEGVFIIVSQRPVRVTLNIDTVSTPRRIFSLAAGSDENQTDMRRFLERAATWPGISRALQVSGYTPEHFTSTLVEKCSGVWIYLHYVVHEIERGERSPLDLGSLPDGMTQYYANYWQQWRNTDENEWYEVYLPLLATLAAAQEAVTLKRLAQWTDVKMPVHELRRLLDERWRPFLVLTKREQELRYRFYHATLREFFDGRVDREKLTVAEVALANELAEATRGAHSSLAHRYLVAWGGSEASLSGLQEATKREIDEGYGLRHLVAHLEGASRAEDLHSLLRLEWVHTENCSYTRRGLGGWWDRLWRKQRQRTEQRHHNAWHRTREQVDQIDGYLVDVAHAWRLAEERFENSSTSQATSSPGLVRKRALTQAAQESEVVGLQCRYALIIASHNSLARKVPLALLVALVKQGVWSPEQGLVYARRVPGLKQRANALAELTPCLPEPLRGEVLLEELGVARGVKDADARVYTLTRLVPHLPEPLRREALREVLAATMVIDKQRKRKALAELALHLPEALKEQVLREALAAAQEIRDDNAHTQILAELALHLPDSLGEETTRKVLATVQARQREYTRTQEKAIEACRLEKQLTGLRRWEQSETANDLTRDADRRARALIGLIIHLPGTERKHALGKALAAARGMFNKRARTRALVELAPHLPKPLSKETLLEALEAAPDPETRVELVTWLAKWGYHQEALEAAGEIGHVDTRANVLAKLAPHLPGVSKDQALQEALALVQTIGDNDVRARVLAGLAPWLAELGCPEEALAAPRMIRDKDERKYALVELALQLAELGYAQEALSAARESRNRHDRDMVLFKLTPRLAELGYPQEALAAARAIRYKSFRASALAELAPHLDESLLREALVTAWAIRDDANRAQALTGLVPRLAELGYPQEALTAARAIRYEHHCAQTLAKMIPYLAEPFRGKALREGLAAARAIKDEGSRVQALAMLVFHLPEPLRKEALRQALAAVRAIRYGFSRALALADLAPHLSEPLLRKALTEVRATRYKDFRMRALTGLAPHLPPLLLRKALAAARETDEQSRAQTLAVLAPHLPGSLLRQALVAAQKIRDTDARVQALAELSSHLPEALKTQALQEALTAARAIQDEDTRSRMLATLAPHLARLPLTTLYPLWRRTLHILASHTRQDLLTDLHALVPVIAALGGATAVAGTFRAIQDVGRWWP